MDDLVAEQIAYYRARAPEYERGAPPIAERLVREVTGHVPAGADVVEFACGTGGWTERLAARAGKLTAVDAAPEMLALAKRRVPSAEFVTADVFSWQPPRRFDIVFFAFWLSHVPADRFAEFWTVVAGCLVEGGRAIFVDEHVRVAGKERWLADEVAERTLSDGSTHRIVKTYLDPAALTSRLMSLGWHADVTELGSEFAMGRGTPPIAQQSPA